ncbi:MAG TPA: ATP-binding protein [Dissulfurispiraceae bacterium]
MKGYIVIVGIFAVIITSLILLNASYQRTLQMETAEQFNKQQLLLAHTEASNIQTYVQRIKGETIHIARFMDTFPVRRGADYAWLTSGIFEDNRNVKKGVKILDGEGRALFAKGDLAGEAADDRDLTKSLGGSCRGDAFIRQDTKRMSIIAPVCRSGAIAGAVAVAIDIQGIAGEFLGPIKSGARGYAWMMDDKGDLLYHPTQPSMVGKNLYRTDTSCFKCHKAFDMERKIIEGKGDYFGKYVAPSGEDKVLAFSTAAVGNARWIVAVSAPYSEVTMSVRRSTKFHSLLITAILLTAGVVSIMLLFAYRKKVQAEEVERRQKELERHADELERVVNERTEELSAEKEKLNTIVSAIRSGILLLDVQGKIQWINQTMDDMAGKDIIGRSWDDVCGGCPAIDSSRTNDLQTELLPGLFGMKDRYFQVTTAPVKGDLGAVHGYIRLVQDVTEMERMEEQIMRSEKLASLGRLTSGLAHDIGDPLTSVFSIISVLRDMEQNEFKKESLETTYFHMNRVADTLKQLSSFSKNPSVELKPWKVSSLIESSLSLIQCDGRAKDVTIVRDLRPDIPEIITDRNRILQVMVNIMLNAIDAMPDGGTLTVRSRAQDGFATVAVEDTGSGISAENFARIFDPFFTTKEKSTGLGLTVSHGIIKRLKGSITVESEAGKGTKFVISLPMEKTEAVKGK